MNLRNKLAFWMALNRYVEIIVRGVSPLSLPDAISGSLRYVKAFGGTIQGVPDGYTMLDSVSNRTQSTCDVNTGVYVDVDDVEIEIQVSAKTGSWYIFQSQKTQSALIWGISGSNSGAKISFNWGGEILQSNITRTSGNTYYVKATAKNGNATLYVKDITNNVEDTVTATYTYGSGPNSWFGIFGTERNPSLSAGNAVYFAKMSVGGKQVLDAIPAQRQSDSVNGFYNKINGQFLIPEELTALNAGTPVVPTPTAPMDIVSNNGVLKYSANIANVNAQTVLVGYYVSASGSVIADPNNWIYQDYIPVSPNTTYTLTMSSPVYYVTISEYSTASGSGFVIRKAGSAGANTTLTITTGATTNFIRFGTNIDRAVVTLDEVLAINWQLNKGNSMPYTPYSPTGIYTDGTVETINVHGKNLFDKTTYIAGKYYNTTGNIVENPNYGMSGFIPMKSGQTFALSGRTPSGIAIFNTSQVWQQQVVGQSFTAPYDGYFVVSVAAGEQDTLQIELGSTATAYQPYYDGGTATTEMLLKVGDYQDVQSIIDGTVNRQLGVFILDGTESWSYSAGYSDTETNACFYIPTGSSTIPILPQTGTSVECLCSHFRWVSRNEIYNNKTPIVGAITGANGEQRIGVSITLRAPLSIAGNIPNNFKQWLADQYAAGTPVIVIYPLATPTTESVTGQTLQVADGNNTLEIIQASLSNLELEAEYTKHK